METQLWNRGSEELQQELAWKRLVFCFDLANSVPLLAKSLYRQYQLTLGSHSQGEVDTARCGRY